MPRTPARTAAPVVDPWSVDRDLPEVVVAAGRLAECTFLTQDEVEVVVLPVAPGPEEGDGLEPRHGMIDAALRYGVDFSELAERASFDGAAGETLVVDLPRAHRSADALPWAGLPERVVLLGLGRSRVEDFRRAGAAIARETRGVGRVLTTASGTDTFEDQRALVEGYLLGAYRAPTAATGAPRTDPAAQLVLLGDHAQRAIDEAARAARAAWLVRDLTTVPSNVKNPGWVADVAERLAHAAGLAVTRLDGPALAAGGFGGLTAVGQGSASEPTLVAVTYTPEDAPADARRVVLVGKGITYDTGGIDIKPRTSMVTMKNDMSGAAVVLATVLAAAEARLPLHVTAVLPLAENHFGASSYRRADVLTMVDGTRVEVGNTDAEGRLVLADGIAWARSTFSPDALIDVATLTGAAAVALGPRTAALLATDDALATMIEQSARTTGEAVWRLPLVDEYDERLGSTVTELRNVPADERGGGAITAALFLRRFVGDVPWAHVDIAGPAHADKASHEVPAGATGFGARLLLSTLEGLAARD
ncbi:leucyl aminopeptidase family protein [Flavimobilis sp. GY10621]|uniref:Probable cytosol aminopeptidase n=1 Tax=Flavimobilis rhizosphaerae TaxID=2775421 RepID=A0ABR9DPF1_9MICO|nr:leucyl aminopeptidase family protein [Flavimobilis rhizosphaerae]MBD9698993.1 leucyl aminopeptidase family protein [Flavimobilis rhizosphaerae]